MQRDIEWSVEWRNEIAQTNFRGSERSAVSIILCFLSKRSEGDGMNGGRVVTLMPLPNPTNGTYTLHEYEN